MPSPARPDDSSALTILSWIFGALDGLATLCWASFGLRIGPTFAEMYAEFGGTVPIATRVVTHPAYGLAVAAAGALVIAYATLGRGTMGRRAGLLGALVVAHAAAWLGSLYVVYLPILATAGDIR
jgi:hypothetical protein